MSRFMSHFRPGFLPRIAAATLALGAVTTASAQDIEIPGTGQNQSATVTVPPGGRACLGAVKGTVAVRATGNANAPLNYFMRRSTTGAQGSFDRIPFSGVNGARQYDFDVDADNRPDLFPGFFKVCATDVGTSSVRTMLTLKGE
jgi:hypothetical protein